MCLRNVSQISSNGTVAWGQGWALGSGERAWFNKGRNKGPRNKDREREVPALEFPACTGIQIL